MSLHRLLGFHIEVPDPQALDAFYQEIGLVGDAISGYSGIDGGAAVTVGTSSFRRVIGIEMGCEDEFDLDVIESRGVAAGWKVKRTSNSVAIVDDVSKIRFTARIAPFETPLKASELEIPNSPGAIVRRNHRAFPMLRGPHPPRRLGHVVIGTPDTSATRDLLVDVFGCQVSDEFEGIIGFLRCSQEHHNIGLVYSPVPLLQHYSWECDDVDHLGHVATALYRMDPARHSWGFGRHFAGSNFFWYFRDPSGSFIELYSDLDRIDDDAQWRMNAGPLDFEHIANSWGPNIPTEFIEPDDLPQLIEAWTSLSSD
jgi:catechol 2,3-dioxygenase-like lactoylglutathione lyase family enzyme